MKVDVNLSENLHFFDRCPLLYGWTAVRRRWWGIRALIDLAYLKQLQTKRRLKKGTTN